jgi:alpha-amylase
MEIMALTTRRLLTCALWPCVAALFLLGACSGAGDPQIPDVPPTNGEEPQAPGTTYWWNDQVFYEVFVRSFYDHDGDGIGDLQGLIERLDYLNDGDPDTDSDLGVTALWLMPIVASPSYHGYDAVDYRTVADDYGDNADFQQLMQAAHARGMRVIVDFVMNHCSTQHPWFVASAAGDPAYADWFLWRQDNPGWTQPWGGGPVWHYNAARGAYYYGVFWGGMPDLNYTHPDVVQEMLSIADFWVQDLAVDGFRLDAVKYMIEAGSQLENTAATFALWSDVRSHLDASAPTAFLVGEAWDDTEIAVQYVEAGLHTCFEFDLAGAIIAAVNQGDANPLIARLRQVMAAYPYHQYATFLTNHDQQRILSQLGGNLGRNRVAAALLLTLPGVPFLYYGEEVGMTSSWTHEDVRRPLHWTSGAAAGFTTGTPWQAPGSNFATNNVAVMQGDPDSLWHHYRRFVKARLASAALRRGTYHRLDTGQGQLLAFLRHHQDEAVVAVHNLQGASLGGWTLSVPRSQLAPGAYTAVDLLTGAGLAALEVGEAGRIDNWQPAASLAGHGSLLVGLSVAD